MGVCLTQLDAASIERALVCAPGTVPTLQAAVLSADRVRFFSGASCPLVTLCILRNTRVPACPKVLWRVVARSTSVLGTPPRLRT